VLVNWYRSLDGRLKSIGEGLEDWNVPAILMSLGEAIPP
jgi:hypothetical protein